jgi:hypothetical protein
VDGFSTSKSLVICLLGLYAYTYRLISNQAWVSPTVFFNDHSTTPCPSDHEWCIDSGANRFITNDSDDFLPDSVELVSTCTTVAVGGGNITSPMSGTVLVKSLDHDAVYACTNVLFLPKCAKKLMPPIAFAKQGCKITLLEDTVHITSSDGKPVLSGVQHGGLYYVHSRTVRGHSHDNAGTCTVDDHEANVARAYYGYPHPDEEDDDEIQLQQDKEIGMMGKAASYFGLSFSGHNPRRTFG